MRKHLNVRKSGDISGLDLVISLPFSSEETIVKWGFLSFENLDSEVVSKSRPNVQMFDVLLLTLMRDEKVESEEEHEGELRMLKTPRRSKMKDNTSSTPAFASTPDPAPTNTRASTPGSAKRTKSTKTRKGSISFVNHPNVNSIVAGFMRVLNQPTHQRKLKLNRKNSL